MRRPADTGLPVEEVVAEVAGALAHPGVAVLVAPPGAGKTTVVPLRTLDAPWLGSQRIVVLEPRRLAARAAAHRMAHLLGEPVGQTVGYRTRDERVVSRATRIEVITEQILVRRLQADPALEGTGLVIADEVHERNLVTDLALALVIDVRTGLRPDLRLLAMSATVEAERVATLLGPTGAPAPVVTSVGRTHTVQVHHVAPGPRDRLDAQVARAVARALAVHDEGDVLAFVPGAADIARVVDRLSAPGAVGPTVDVRPLFGALPTTEQDQALAPSPPGRRRVVVATDIAESSLTVAGVRIVVDAGLVRVPRVDPATGMTTLQTEPASIAAADQRSGRAGRVGPGHAYRLWDKAENGRRRAHPVAEISVADLAGFALEVAVWGASVDELALLDAPPRGALERARSLLVALGAIDGTGRPSASGRAMAELPLHPRLAALALRGAADHHGWTAAVVAALLEEREVLRGRPDELPVDLAVRVDAVDGAASVASSDRGAVRTVRRRAEQLAGRLGVRPGPIDADQLGVLVAMAYPDRLAQAQGGGGFRLREGGGGHVPAGDALAGAAYLAVARIDDGPRGRAIRLAVELDATAVEALVEPDVVEVEELVWDPARDDLRARRVRRAGALVLSVRDGPATPGSDATAALVERVGTTGGAVLRWTDAARAVERRVTFLHLRHPEAWPGVDRQTLLATLDEWLVPLLAGAVGRRDLERVDLRAAVLARLDHQQRAALDRLAPEAFTTADGRRVAISYDEGVPRASVRVQHLFGSRTHPTVDAGQVPVVLELLSPAARPIQVTADLPGFWAGSWAAVRKEMAGRYPKHPWPVDPSSASPPASRRR